MFQFLPTKTSEGPEILNNPEALNVPSAQTIRRLQSIINTDELERFYAEFFAAYPTCSSQNTMGFTFLKDVVGFDGQTMRGTGAFIIDPDDPQKIKKVPGYDIVSFFDCTNRVCLSQTVVDKKNNEAVVLDRLLSLINVSNTIITWDALNTRVNTLESVVAKGADFVVSLKENQGALYDAVEDAFSYIGESTLIDDYLNECRQIWYGHGRIEEKECFILPAQVVLPKELAKKWKHIKSVIMVKTTKQYIRNGSTTEPAASIRYFISSIVPDETDEHFADRMANTIRSRWGVEVQHYVLDCIFGQDGLKLRNQDYIKNMTVFTKIAVSMIGYVRGELPPIRSKILATHEAFIEAVEADPLAGLEIARAYFNHNVKPLFEVEAFYATEAIARPKQDKHDDRNDPIPEVFTGDSPLERKMRERRKSKKSK